MFYTSLHCNHCAISTHVPLPLALPLKATVPLADASVTLLACCALVPPMHSRHTAKHRAILSIFRTCRVTPLFRTEYLYGFGRLRPLLVNCRATWDLKDRRQPSRMQRKKTQCRNKCARVYLCYRGKGR